MRKRGRARLPPFDSADRRNRRPPHKNLFIPLRPEQPPSRSLPRRRRAGRKALSGRPRDYWEIGGFGS